MNLLIKRWPDKLQRNLKIKAIRNGITLREALIQAAGEWVKKREISKKDKPDAKTR